MLAEFAAFPTEGNKGRGGCAVGGPARQGLTLFKRASRIGVAGRAPKHDIAEDTESPVHHGGDYKDNISDDNAVVGIGNIREGWPYAYHALQKHHKMDKAVEENGDPEHDRPLEVERVPHDKDPKHRY